MSNVYDKGFGLYKDKGPEDHIVDTTVFDLLTSDDVCIIDGIRILRKGTPEYDEHIDEILKRYEESERNGGLSPGTTERTAKLLRESEFHYDDSPFKGMNYSDLHGKRLLWDTKLGVVCEVSVEKKQIDAFRLYRPNSDILADFFIDPAKKARFRNGYHYDGSLCEALSEFVENGYTFNVWDEKWRPSYLKDGEPTRDISHLTPIEGVSLDDVLSHKWREGE